MGPTLSTTTGSKAHTRSSSDPPWLTLIKTWGAKAVLLDRGAHYTETSQFAEELQLTVLTLRERYPDLLILYMASVAGHKGCESIEVPLEKAQDRASLPFHWGDFHEQNGIAQRIVEKYGGVFLDVEPMTELRADGHRGDVRTIEGRRHDCLHHCSPGKQRQWKKRHTVSSGHTAAFAFTILQHALPHRKGSGASPVHAPWTSEAPASHRGQEA